MIYTNAHIFDTERLICRPFLPSDAEDMLRNWVADPDVQNEYGEPVYTDISQVNALLEEYTKGTKSKYRWAVIEKSSGENIGQIAFCRMWKECQTAEVEYCIGSRFQGRGYAGEVLAGLIRYAFAHTDVEKLEAYHRAENTRSGRVLAKSAMHITDTVQRFAREGIAPEDEVCYCIAKNEYYKMRKELSLMGELHIIDHPLVQHKISLLRDKNTGTKEFRELVSEIAMFICYEATRDLPLKEIELETPIAVAKTKVISGKKLAIVPILRAGLGMVDGVTSLVPAAKIGHIGIFRDPDSKGAVQYYSKMPEDISEREVIIVDPMLATGNSATAAITEIKKLGVSNIKFMCIIASPEGVKAVTTAHPDVDVYTGVIDEGLNEDKYIVPGVGDAGDRIFGTK